MSRLRGLVIEDSIHMMEFVNDIDIAGNFKFTRFPFSISNFEKFIIDSWKDKNNVHFAIEEDDYAGTISLKNINYIDKTAEYAIAIRKKYWGTGTAKEATDKIIDYAFNKLNLEKVYLNVLASNVRANKFYNKYGFQLEGIFKKHIYVNGKYEDLNWYCIFKSDFI